MSAGRIEWTAAKIASAVQSGEVSAAEIARAFCERISRADELIRAFAAVRDPDDVEADAAAIDARGDRDQLPLAGVPIAIKDNLRVAGLPCRFGSGAMPAEPVPEHDELVRRVEAAGAVVLGTTTMPELALWSFTQAEVYGSVTRNPWDPAFTPGGSSGGSGAAVAAKMAPIAIGSDGLGSIRIPSSCCGLFGIKPGAGLLPTPDKGGWFGQSEFGPMATTVQDATTLLGVLAGEAIAPEPPRSRDIVVWTRAPVPGISVDSEVVAAVDRVASQLEQLGHRVTRAATPRPLRTALALIRRWFAVAADDVRDLDLDMSRLEPGTRAHVRLGQRVMALRPPSEREGEWLRRNLAETAFDHYDLVLTPTLSHPPMAISDCRGPRPVVMYRVIRFAPFTGMWNLARFPSASIPAGVTRSGLPVGVTLSGPPDSEPAILSVARQLEQHHPWRRHAPD